MTASGSQFTDVSKSDGVAVVRFHDLNSVISRSGIGRIDSLNSELLSVADRSPLLVILDFEGKAFAPCHAFQDILIRLHKRLGARLKLCNLPERVAEHFEISRLAKLLNIYPTLEAAIKDADGT